MKDNMIDGASLKECLVAAASALEQKQRLNDLNVFPVPDGDTGTNMSLTMKSVLKDVQAVSDITVPNISAAASRGALKGARETAALFSRSCCAVWRCLWQARSLLTACCWQRLCVRALRWPIRP